METSHTQPAASPEDSLRVQSAESTPEEEGERNVGIQHLLRFLKKVFRTDDLNNSERFAEILSGIDEDQLRQILLRINGLVNNIPISERSMPERGHTVTTKANEQVHCPPSKESSDVIFTEAYNAIRELSTSNEIIDRQRIALIFFHLITCLHSFADGNGRTARIAYTLFTPYKKSFTQKDFENILLLRPKNLDIYHNSLQNDVFLALLEDRGLIIDDDYYDDEESTWKPHLETDHREGFDVVGLGFISAYDAMTDEERAKYSHYYPDGHYCYFDLKDFSPELILRINSQHNKSREDLVRAIIFDISINEENWSAERMDPLYKGWGYEPSAT